jgi:hypothetical protein
MSISSSSPLASPFTASFCAFANSPNDSINKLKREVEKITTNFF